MVVPVIAAAGAATGRVIAKKVVTKKGKTGGATVLKGQDLQRQTAVMKQNQANINRPNYLKLVEKKEQEKLQQDLYQSQNGLTTTGDRILNKRAVVQNAYRKKQGLTGYVGRKTLKEAEENLEKIYQSISNGYDLDFEVRGGNTHGALRNAYTLYLQVKAARAGWIIFWTAIPFWVPQIYCWMLAVAGLGSETVWLLSYLIPGETIFNAMNYIIIFIGIVTMIYTFLMYLTFKINCFGGMKGLVFAACVALYCTPFVNFAPWFLCWVVFTTYSQKPGFLTRMVLH